MKEKKEEKIKISHKKEGKLNKKKYKSPNKNNDKNEDENIHHLEKNYKINLKNTSSGSGMLDNPISIEELVKNAVHEGIKEFREEEKEKKGKELTDEIVQDSKKLDKK